MNPYDPPKGNEKLSKLERTLAARLLEVRETGFTLGLYYRWMLKAYVILVFAIGLGMAWFAFLNFHWVVLVLLGVLVGTLLRDYGYGRRQIMVWKAQEKLFDWDKVRRMAAGEPLG